MRDVDGRGNEITPADDEGFSPGAGAPCGAEGPSIVGMRLIAEMRVARGSPAFRLRIVLLRDFGGEPDVA